jgi:hypothetical protein
MEAMELLVQLALEVVAEVVRQILLVQPQRVMVELA